MVGTSIERPDMPVATRATGRTLFAAEYGPQDAPTVVLLHGSGSSGWMWKNQVQAFARDLHLLVPDLPGHGQSNTA